MTTLAALLIALAMVGCGGDDDDGGDQPTGDVTDVPSGEARAATAREVQYLEAVALVIEESNTGIAALEAERAAAFDPANTAIETEEALATLSSNAIDVYETRRDGILNVMPQPSNDLQSLHLTISGAADDQVTIAEHVAVALDEEPVRDDAGYEALLIEQGFPQGVMRFQDSCTLLQNEADRLSADVDMHCVGAEPTS